MRTFAEHSKFAHASVPMVLPLRQRSTEYGRIFRMLMMPFGLVYWITTSSLLRMA